MAERTGRLFDRFHQSSTELGRQVSLILRASSPISTLSARRQEVRMALLSWSSNYSVGVQRMDQQHTVLFGMLNDLHESMMKGQAQQIAGPLLRKLATYTHEHFTAEERMMVASGYAGLAHHRGLHRELIKQVDEFAVRYERGETALNLQLLNFLRDWLSNHIQNEDKKYGPWMNEHGTR